MTCILDNNRTGLIARRHSGMFMQNMKQLNFVPKRSFGGITSMTASSEFTLSQNKLRKIRVLRNVFQARFHVSGVDGDRFS